MSLSMIIKTIVMYFVYNCIIYKKDMGNIPLSSQMSTELGTKNQPILHT